MGDNRPRWVIVVRKDRAELHRTLHGAFERSPWVEVVLDRRRDVRRHDAVLPEVERRMADRRATPGDPLRRATHRLAQSGDGFAVYEALGLAPAQCRTCSSTVWFEMPRFAEPPVRLVLNVEHETVQRKLARHFVALSAFGATGRLLVSSRVAARVSTDPLREPG